MQYVRSISGSVGAAWNSINPATLSGAIDVIVVEQEDGSLACSPFHIRFGKFRLLRPSEKKVEFSVNGKRQEYPMKLGDGGEAFFVFETRASVPEALQTSPPVSPQTSPTLQPSAPNTPALQEPDPFELEGVREPTAAAKRRLQSKSTSGALPTLQPSPLSRDGVDSLPIPRHNRSSSLRPASGDFSGYSDYLLPKLERNATDSELEAAKGELSSSFRSAGPILTSGSRAHGASPLRARTDLTPTPPPFDNNDDAKARAMNLSKKLWTSNISNQVTESGDLMLDMTGYKSSEGEALQAEIIARQLLSEEMEGPYDIGALIGADEKGNVWIYRSEEAKAEANRKAAGALGSYNPAGYASVDALSDPGYHSDDARSETPVDFAGSHVRRDSDSAVGMASQPGSPGGASSSTSATTSPATAGAGDPNLNYAKTLRLTSEQLKMMDLQPGANAMSFTVNRATCSATLWYWRHDVPIVISDIDGTITKSDVLGHAFNFIGRDWTHSGVAKLYTDIAANGYNFLYLTSRSVGQADTTRGYLDGVVQDGFKLPRGPVILSPDRTIAALRREVYLRKPEVFKMACLRDIMALFSGPLGGSSGGSASSAPGAAPGAAGAAGAGAVTNMAESQEAGLHHPTSSLAGAPGNSQLGSNRGRGGSPFYAGFGNRLTDALSYRSVNIPSTRIFTINSNSEVSLDLLSLNKYKTAYGTMREIVDHYFPAVGLLVRGGGEEFTDFNYWRNQPLDVVDFTDSESEADDEDDDDEDDDDDHGRERKPPPIDRAIQRAQTAQALRERLLSEDEAEDDQSGDDLMDSYLDSDARLSLEEGASSIMESGDELASSIMEDEEYDSRDEYDETDDEQDQALLSGDEAERDNDTTMPAMEPSTPTTPKRLPATPVLSPRSTPMRSQFSAGDDGNGSVD